MEPYFCSCRGIYILFIKKTMYLKEVLQKQTAIFLVLIIYMQLLFLQAIQVYRSIITSYDFNIIITFLYNDVHMKTMH